MSKSTLCCALALMAVVGMVASNGHAGTMTVTVPTTTTSQAVLPDNGCTNDTTGNGAGGVTVQIINNWDGSGDNLFATLDTESANGLCNLNNATNCGNTANCTAGPGPTCQPDASLAGFNGLTSPGTWTLAICDRATGDAVTLNTWSMIATGDPFPVELQSFTAE